MTLISTQISNIIATVGFPIAAFLMMWRLANTTLKENTKAIQNLTTTNNVIIEKFIKKLTQ